MLTEGLSLLDTLPELGPGSGSAGPPAEHDPANAPAALAWPSSPNERRLLAVWLPWWPVERLARQEPELPLDRPLVLIRVEAGRQLIAGYNLAASGLGLAIDQPLADARALVPALATRPADPEGDRLALTALADWATRYCPWVALADEATLLLDITGCAHLFAPVGASRQRAEATLAREIGRRLGGFGLTARLAIAATPGAAWGHARHDRYPGPHYGPRDLRTLPVAALRLPEELLEGLRRFGLRRIGDVLALPRPALTARFGGAVLDRLDRMLGVIQEPIEPRLPQAAVEAARAFAEPILTQPVLEKALDGLLSTVCSQLEAASLGARRLELRAYRVDGQLQTRVIGTSQPVRDAAALLRLLVPKLEGIDAGFGFERVVLSVTAAAPFGALQSPLLAGAESEAVADRALAGLIDALESRLGAGRIQRPMPWQAWLPEQAVRARGPFEPHLPDDLTAEAWPADRPRPLRLFERPEPISVMAPVPDDPPVLFRWRGAVHRMRRADGPERLAPPWWRVPPAEREQVRPRDYYRLEDSDGRRFWVYRDGPMGDDTPAGWFMHGIFG